MKRTFIKIIKYTSIILLAIIVIFSIFIFGSFLFSKKVKFDINKIKYSTNNIEIFDNSNRVIKEKTNNKNFVKINTLNKHTKEAFISIEDKDFYKHKGLNHKRMIKAMLKNITSLKIKEGASTISQQLIKNTHLSNEKTFKRKLNEISLTKKLEKTLSKEQILEYYLNIIYFGDNCYGIENASNHYFNKNAKNLTLAESAVLAGMIKSPNRYSPTKNIKITKERRNLVLYEMLKDKKISFDEYTNAKQTEIKTDIKNINLNNLNSYSKACLDEAINILKMPAKQISIGEYKIYTYYNQDKQNELVNSMQYYLNNQDCLAVSMTKECKIEAYNGNSKIKLSNVKRQPGSTIKPILVYAPALNENIINPLTQINDENININGYTPKNINNVFHGYVSIRECVSNSLNIPAVKVLSYTGIKKAKSYATKSGIEFDHYDNNLGLALGGMTYGTTLNEITSSYSIFNNNGNYKKPTFIKYITDKNNKIVYIDKTLSTNVIREDTAYLMTDILKTCAKKGTGRKLGNLNFEVATKTGTVGKTFNTDAYNISYTSNDLVGIWVGNVDNKKIDTVGSGIPTDIAKHYLSNIYKDNKPENFKIPSSVYEEKIDLLSLNKEHVVYKANNYIPESYITTEMFSKFNPPKEKSTKFISCNPPVLQGKIKEKNAILSFNAEDYLIYELHKIENNKDTILSIISNKQGMCNQTFNIKNKCKYYIITKIKNFADNTEIVSDKSNIVELMPINNNNLIKIDTNSKWYI